MQKHHNKATCTGRNSLHRVHSRRQNTTIKNDDQILSNIDISLNCEEDETRSKYKNKHRPSNTISNLSSCNQSQDIPETVDSNMSSISVSKDFFAFASTPVKKKKNMFKPKFHSVKDIDNEYNEEEDLNKRTEMLHHKRAHYLVYNTNFDCKKRYILLDWIMDVCNTFGFKRSTYYLCVVLIDSYMTQIQNVSINQLQLIGVCCLIIAAKNEEIKIPCTAFFAQSTDNSCPVEEIKRFQMVILKELRFRIQYPTLETWSNYMMKRWDDFAREENKKFNNELIFPLFRNDPKYDYGLFRHFFLILDIISLDYFHIFFNEKDICSCLIYLIVGLGMNYFTMEMIGSFFEKKDYNASFYSFHNLLIDYFNREFSIFQEDFSQTIKYVCNFFQCFKEKGTLSQFKGEVYLYITLYRHTKRKFNIRRRTKRI